MSERHTKVVLLLQELAAKFVQHEANADPLITITSADASLDFKKVTSFFKTMPEEKE